MGKRVADMTPEELERQRAWRRNQTPEQREKNRAAQRKWIGKMTPEELERNRARDRRRGGAMTAEQREEKLTADRDRKRVSNLPPEQLKQLRERDRRRSAEKKASKSPDIEVFMLNKIDNATRRPGPTYIIPSICPPELAAKLAPVLEMLKTADAAQRAAIRGVVRTMRAARELELLESVAQ